MADIISGLAHGAQDAKDNCNHPDGCHWWILMPGSGLLIGQIDMKTIIAGLAILIMLGAVTPSAFALTAYQSGFQHGVSDGKDSCLHPDGCHWYILQPGKGFADHSKEFIRGYINGWCLSSPPGGGADADQASFECGQPGYSPQGND